MHYRNATSVEFAVYSDEETFCLNISDLNFDGKTLSYPVNGTITILTPVRLDHFGTYKINDNNISTRKLQLDSYKKWYQYINGTIRQDTIHFTEKYTGTDPYKFKKSSFTRSSNENFVEIYQPNLSAEKNISSAGLVYYFVTGTFNAGE